jgi:hypothetical protein
MRYRLPFCYLLAAAAVLAVGAIACQNATGLSKTPRATFSKIACLDVNHDNVINDADAADPSKLPDFNADDKRDEQDAAFVKGVNIQLDPSKNACAKDSPDEPEYAVGHGFFKSSDVSCDSANKPVLIVGVGGGVVNLKDKGSAAGIREIMDDLQGKYDDRDVETISVLAGPAMAGAVNIHSGMEQWLTHAVQVYLDRYPCLRTVIVGHSHGAVTGDVVSSGLEGAYGDRFIVVVDLDRVTKLYTGDTESRPTAVPVFNVFETRDPGFPGAPYDAPNAENWDASGEQGPEHGDEGGALKPVNHTTIDNSKSVRDRIVSEVMERS